MRKHLKSLGPGLLFAGAAIGVSHLVQSTRAGADYGFGLLWALLLVNLFKYPFFQYGPRYALAAGESLIDGYARLGKGVLWFYFLLTVATMFTIQTAVTIVTAGIAAHLFGGLGEIGWTIAIIFFCLLLLAKGRYKLLDSFMKVIIIALTVSTILSVILAWNNDPLAINLDQIIPSEASAVAFLIAFMGWMPAPLDISIWHSLWSIEKKKQQAELNTKEALTDFNVGYLTTVVLGAGFIALGALVMYGSGERFSDNGLTFASQLINLYTQNLGEAAHIFIAVAALTTMFSTTLSTLDASPRAMTRTSELITQRSYKNGYLFWILVLASGTIAIFLFLQSNMGLLVKVATVLSFVTAPFYAIINLKLISSRHTPTEWHPSLSMKILSWLGIFFLIGFSIWYLYILFLP